MPTEQQPRTQHPMHRSHVLRGNRAALTELYRNWAVSYDRDVLSAHYVAPLICALIARQACNDGAVPRVLDVGCGTGLVGFEISQVFPRAEIIGGDLSPEMADRARSTGVYAEVVSPLDINETLPPAWSANFDLVICCGTFTNGHVGPHRVADLLALCRPGGQLVISVRRNYSDACCFPATIDRLVSENRALCVTEVHNGPYIAEEGAHYWCLQRA